MRDKQMVRALLSVQCCPFEDRDHLARCADTGMAPLLQEITSLLQEIEAGGMGKQVTRLDDLYLAAINAAQNTTIRDTVCLFCDQDKQCHPDR